VASPGGDASLLRKLNAAAILRVLHQVETGTGSARSADDSATPAMSVTEIAAACGVSRPTAEDVVEGLLERGWADEELPDPSKPRAAGRPARRFRFRAGAGYVLGIDLGSDPVLVLISDLVGNIVASCQLPVSLSAEPGERMAAVQRAVDAALKTAGLEHDALLAAAVGTTGIVDSSGRVVLSAVLPGWTGLDLAGEIRKFVTAPVVVQNDLRLGAVAERWRGAAKGADDVVYLHAGIRMGSGFLIDGRPHRGFRGAAGELSSASGHRWIRAYNRMLEQAGHPAAVGQARRSRTGLAGDAATIFEAAASGDSGARQAVEAFALELIRGAEALVVTIDPEVVVVGGSLSRAGEFIAEPIRQHLAKTCIFEPRVAISPLGDEAVALGAIRIALDDVEARLFTDGLATDAGRVRT
jgi:predicted NBD/HSP70 family sugar kinase